MQNLPAKEHNTQNCADCHYIHNRALCTFLFFIFWKSISLKGQADTQPVHVRIFCVCVGSATLATVWQEVKWNQEGHLVICTINQYRYRCRRHRKLLEWEKWEALECICVYALACAYPRSPRLRRQSWVSMRAHASRALITLGYLWTYPLTLRL